ncbi:unnamed protein product [Porites evermanni]|uniref:Uncharacterized protein n=1 Tax=Porites evermanni TaxID=104178 RepID=A0ABN8SGH3_9CNID|nr:unnamed protein product [Porites evermanni]
MVKRNIFIFSSTSTELFFVYLIPDQIGIEGKTGVPREKPLGANERTNNRLNPHYLNLGHIGGRSDCVRPSVSIVTGDSLRFTINV